MPKSLGLPPEIQYLPRRVSFVKISDAGITLNRTKYSRVDQVKFVEDSF